MIIDYYIKKVDNESIEECKKWVYLDRSKFVNYKAELELLDSFTTMGELISWIKQKTGEHSIMSGIPKAALTCIYHSILLSI